MPKTYNEVREEYQRFKSQFPDDPTDLPSFAKQLDVAEGTQGERQEAYTDAWYKQANAAVDRGFAATGVPEVTGKVVGGLGALFDEAAGTNVAPTVERIGTDLPRMLTESVATIPAAVSGVGAPAAGAMWLNRANQLRKILGYGSTGLSGYAQTDSPLGAVINVGSMGASNKLLLPAERGGVDLAGKAASAIRDRLGIGGEKIVAEAGRDLTSAAPNVAYSTSGLKNTAAVAGGVGAEAVAQTGINELTRQAQMSVGPNAVGITDPSRNPLTAENVAGNVVGLLPFAPQLALGASSASGFDPRQAKPLMEWIKNRREATEATARGVGDGPVSPDVVQDVTGKSPVAGDMEFDLKSAVEAPKFDEKDTATLRQSVITELGAARSAEAEGRVEDAAQYHARAAEILEKTALKLDLTTAAQETREVDVQARMMAPSTPQGLSEFVGKVNGLIDFYNENRAKAAEGEAGEVEVVSTPGHPRQTSHPEARDPSVVTRLQEKGLLPKIDYEWLKKEYSATFDDSGNAKFSQDVLAQKVANHLLDNLPTALRAEAALGQQATTPVSPRVAKVDSVETEFFRALASFPPEFQDGKNGLVSQTIKFRSAPDAFVQGRQMSRYGSWQRAVITAANSYDPVTQTVMAYKQGKLQRVPLANLMTSDYNPVYTPVKAGEGGKGKVTLKGKTIPETNLEALKNQETGIGFEPKDEALLGEEIVNSGGAGLEGMEQLKYKPASAEANLVGETASPVEGIAIPEQAQTSLVTALTKNAETIAQTVPKLTPEQAWNFLRPVVVTGGRATDVSFYEKHAKTILEALPDLTKRKGDEISPAGQQLVAAWTATGRKLPGTPLTQAQNVLMTLLKSHVELPGVSQMTTTARGDRAVANRAETALGRARQIVERLTQKKAVEASGGYKGPMRMAGETTTPEMVDTLAGTPNAFAPDTMAAVTSAIDRHFGTQGYSGDLRSMYQAATLAIVRSMEKVPVDFYKISGENVAGLANAGMVEGRGQVGLGLEPTSMETSSHFVHRVLTALTHELAHIDDFVHFGALKAPDAFSEERNRQLTNLRSMYDVLDADQRKAVLTTLDEGLTPPGYRTSIVENPTQLQRATQDVEEFSASVMTMVTKSLLFGKGKKLDEALATLDHSPIEVQEYAQFQFRAIRDILQAMESAVEQKTAKGSNPYVLGKAFHAVTSAAIEASRVRDGVKEVGLAREMVQAMTNGANTLPLVESDAVWHRRQKTIEETFGSTARSGPYAMANAKDAMEQAAGALGLKAYGKDQKPGVWARWFYPFAQLMHSMERSGVDLARPLFNLVNDTESAVHRRYTDIVSPFIKQRPDGTRAWNDDHPLIKNQNPAVRKGINEVSKWQAENGHVPMFVEVEGQLVADTAARPEWERIRQRLSLDDQQTVIAASVAMDKVGQNMARHTLSVLDESLTIRTARLLQVLDKRLSYDQAFAQADRIVQAYQLGQSQTLTGLDPRVSQAVDGMLGGQEGLVAQFGKVKAILDARPGFRTEQLPHDWIVMYKTPEGETKFWSAPTEKQAYYGRDRLAQQGNTPVGEVANKTDLRSKYQAFDDPDVLLAKFAQVEGTQWEKAIEAVRAGFGSEVAEELKAAYTPGAASLKDVGSQGFSKFLKGAKSQIDRDSFDYLDAMLARAARLSASASYKTHGGMKDLILNDPRARMFPSLQNMVNEHWDNMLAPTSDLTKKVKALATGYFLGANLSSAAIEGTQSIMTVIPSLIASNDRGGPVKAYTQLGKAIADASNVTLSKDWHKVAATAEGKVKDNVGANLTADETRALMYKRAVADGVIGHGVVQDLLFSRDQKTLQTAKFGQGDYGPVPLTELAGNKLYLGAQFLTGLYSVTSKFNDKVSFFAGLNQGIEKGLSGDELYNHARQFKTLSTFGGGKANAPGWVAKVSNVHTRSAVGMVNTLQQYGYGMVAMYSQFAKDSIDAAKSLTPHQRSQARKAFGTMLATQVAVGGVLGVPFAGATLTLIEKLFGIPANQLVREGLAELGGDEDQGGVIAETTLNGLGNQMFGLDLSSRLGVTNLLGTSSYRGFNVQDMLGPVPGMIENMAKTLNWFGQGEPMKAAHALVPAAFKNVLAMADSHRKYGDLAVRDQSENLLYTPTAGQSIARGFGFRSREESQKRQATTLVAKADERNQTVWDREADGVARRLLQGDPSAARVYAQELRSADPSVDTSAVLRGVMERAVRMTQEKDLLAGGSRRGAEERKRIVGTFGGDVNTRQSETAAMRLRMQLAAQLGAPDLMPDGRVMSRAAVIDGMVRERGVTRSQATALVGMMGL